jgi:hypothetical protein
MINLAGTYPINTNLIENFSFKIALEKFMFG